MAYPGGAAFAVAVRHQLPSQACPCPTGQKSSEAEKEVLSRAPPRPGPRPRGGTSLGSCARCPITPIVWFHRCALLAMEEAGNRRVPPPPPTGARLPSGPQGVSAPSGPSAGRVDQAEGRAGRPPEQDLRPLKNLNLLLLVRAASGGARPRPALAEPDRQRHPLGQPALRPHDSGAERSYKRAGQTKFPRSRHHYRDFFSMSIP